MRKIMLFSCLLSIVFFPTDSYCQDQSIELYYKYTNAAELNIIDSNYHEALKQYDSAFLINKQPFAKDIFNASIASLKIKQYQKTYFLLKKLVALGFRIKDLKKKNDLDLFWSTSYGKKALVLNKSTKPVYNISYRNNIIKLVSDDQLFRLKPNAYDLYQDTINKIDKKNTEIFLKLIKTYGFPSQYKIGVAEDNLTNPLFDVLIIHQSGPFQIFNYSSIIKEAIKNGTIDNKTGSYLIERSNGTFEYSNLGLIKATYDSSIIIEMNNGLIIKKDSIFDTGWGYFEIPEKALTKIDNNRISIFLDSYYENLRKQLFSTRKTEFILGSTGGKSIFDSSNYQFFLDTKAKLIIK